MSDFGFQKFPDEISDFVPVNRIYSLRAETMVDGLPRAFRLLEMLQDRHLSTAVDATKERAAIGPVPTGLHDVPRSP